MIKEPYNFHAVLAEVDFKKPGQALAAYQFRAGDKSHITRDPDQPREWWENVIRFHDKLDKDYFGARGNNKLQDRWDNRRKGGAQ
jgi:hypothetical protein